MDVKALYQSLATKPILKAMVNPQDNEIQQWLNKNTGLSLKTQESHRPSIYDPLTEVARQTLNSITSHLRQNSYGEKNGQIDTKILEQAMDTDLRNFATTNGYPILRQALNRIQHTKTLKDLIENLTENNINLHDLAFNLLPGYLKNLKGFYNANLQVPTSIYFLHDNSAISADKITTKQLQSILKSVNMQITTPDINGKYGITEQVKIEDTFTKMYKHVKDPKLRSVWYRIIQGDVFSKDRMKKFGMTEDDICTRCGQPEDKAHLLFSCIAARKMWKYYNTIMTRASMPDLKVNNHIEAILPSPTGNYLSETLKIIVLRANIQIERPKHNLEALLKNLFQFQAKIELKTFYRKLASNGKKNKVKSSLWQRLNNIL
jgi:hypothetical protein